MWLYICIALGGAAGSVSRHFLSTVMTDRLGSAFPYGTLSVNVIGSLLIGVFFYLSSSSGRFEMSDNMKQLLIAGFCGGFTTFSAFSLQTLLLIKENAWLRAGAYVTSSVALCMLFVWLGFLICRKMSL